jgi:acyl dehydratase
MRVFGNVDELSAAIGDTLDAGPWVMVDQVLVDAFADITDDHQWIHVDTERASSSPLNGTIAHGFLTLSLIPRLIRDCYQVDAGSMRFNYGLDRVRFLAPLPVGIRIRARVHFDDLVRIASGNRLTTSVTIEAEGLERPVCIATLVLLMVD